MVSMKAQGAIEYMFMIAAVMVAVLLSISVLNHPTTDNIKSTSHEADFSSIQTSVEMIAQKYNSSTWWDTHKDLYNSCMKGDNAACEAILKEYPDG